MAGIVWTGQVNFTDSSDVGTTGVATLTLTPDIGVSNLPALVNGTPGLPPKLRNITVNQVTAGQTPSASTFSKVSDGGPGVASEYDLVLYINKGEKGDTGSTTITSASDVTGTLSNGYTIAYNSVQSKWLISPTLAGDIYAPTTYSSYSGNSNQATLATLQIPAQPFDWRPDVDGFALVNPTSGASTKVELYALLNSTVSGDTVGIGPGVVGNGSLVSLQRAFGGTISSTAAYGRVYAGQACTLYLVAKNNGGYDNWSITNTNVNFTVKVNPIPAVYAKPLTLTINGSPTGGTFTLTYGGYTTTAINLTDPPATVRSKIEALTSVGTGNVTVTSSSTSSPYYNYTITLSSNLATTGFTATTSFTGGTSPTISWS